MADKLGWVSFPRGHVDAVSTAETWSTVDPPDDCLVADVALTGFSADSDGQSLDVTYTVSNNEENNALPFTMGIYTSSDGATPDALLAD
jgi:hypothetical protein